MLSHLYPDWKFTFVMLISIDIFSHWFHVNSVSGHHKAEDTLKKRNFILRAYYAVPFLFAYCCIGAELFYVLLYTLHFYPHPMVSMVCLTSLFFSLLSSLLPSSSFPHHRFLSLSFLL
jgi:CDP-diacylglycerol--inositol 3-phosphatidyltransferase